MHCFWPSSFKKHNTTPKILFTKIALSKGCTYRRGYFATIWNLARCCCLGPLYWDLFYCFVGLENACYMVTMMVMM